jgi:hypothetical protein
VHRKATNCQRVSATRSLKYSQLHGGYLAWRLTRVDVFKSAAYRAGELRDASADGADS